MNSLQLPSTTQIIDSIFMNHSASFVFWIVSWTAMHALGGDLNPITKNHYRADDLAIFTTAAEWVVFSLDPNPWIEEDPFAAPADPTKPIPETKKPERKVPPEQEFHEYPILGQTKCLVNDNLKTVITTLDEAARHWSGGVAACFSPRHGIRVMKNGQTYDLLICYECMSAYLYRDAEQIGAIYFAVESRLLPRPAFLNGVLRRANIKLVPNKGD